MHGIPGIFTITNSLNGKFYLGQTKDLEKACRYETARNRYAMDVGFRKDLEATGKDDLVFSGEAFPTFDETKTVRRNRLINLHENPLCVNKDTGYSPISIFRYTHKASGKYYLGGAASFTLKRQRHLDALREGVHPQHQLQELFAASGGSEAFEWSLMPWGKRGFKGMLAELARQLEIAANDPLCLNLEAVPDAFSLGEYYPEEARKAQRKGTKARWADLEYRKGKRDGNHSKARPVSIEGVEYSCVSTAARALKMDTNKVFYRLYTQTPRWKDWFYTDGKPIPVLKKTRSRKPIQWCCYLLVYQPTGQTYVGMTRYFKKRKANHLNLLNNGSHHAPKLQALYAKDANSENWSWKAIVCDTKEQALDTEEQFANELISTGKLLNAAGNTRFPVLSTMENDEIRKKQQASLKKVQTSSRYRRKTKKTFKMLWADPEFRAKMLKRRKVTGSEHHRSSQVEIDGAVYGSVREAAKETKENRKAIAQKCRSADPEWSHYKLLPRAPGSKVEIVNPRAEAA